MDGFEPAPEGEEQTAHKDQNISNQSLFLSFDAGGHMQVLSTLTIDACRERLVLLLGVSRPRLGWS